MEELIKPLGNHEYDATKEELAYSNNGSPDSTEEMKNLESRQAAVTLLQIKNHDPMKYVVKTDDDNQIIFNSVPSFPPSEKAREVMHCNAVIDILNKAVAQRQIEDARNMSTEYALDRRPCDVASPKHVSRCSPAADRLPDNKEIDLSLYGTMKDETVEQDTSTESECSSYFQRVQGANEHASTGNHKSQITIRQFIKTKPNKDVQNSSFYDVCSPSSSDTDPDRLQMDVSQMSQVSFICLIKAQFVYVL